MILIDVSSVFLDHDKTEIYMKKGRDGSSKMEQRSILVEREETINANLIWKMRPSTIERPAYNGKMRVPVTTIVFFNQGRMYVEETVEEIKNRIRMEVKNLAIPLRSTPTE